MAIDKNFKRLARLRVEGYFCSFFPKNVALPKICIFGVEKDK